MPPSTSAARRGRPPRLTPDRVVAEARRMGAEQGIERLSLRRLAAALGVMPNALYTYFPDKAAILDAVLDDLLGDVRPPRPAPRPPASPETGWRDGVVALMTSYRRLLLAQPGLIALTVSRPMIGANALRLRENMLTLLRRGRLGDTVVVTAFLALFAYTTGFVAFETARTPGPQDAEQRARAAALYQSLDEEQFPSTRALAHHLAPRPGDREFTRGLRGMIAGFAPSAPSEPPGHPGPSEPSRPSAGSEPSHR